MYTGWITVATFANIAAAAVYAKSNGFGLSNETWAIVALAAVLVLALIVIFARRDIAYSLVIVWALAGIAVKQSNNQSIVTTAEIGIIVILAALALAIAIYRMKRSRKVA